MRKPAQRWIGGAGALILGGLAWMIFRTPPPTTTPAKLPPPLKAAEPVAAKRVENPSDGWPEFGTPEFKAMAPERIRQWLESRRRDAASLVAAWDITGEESLLKEAAEKFPNDPRVCLAMIAWLPPGDVLPWIERLIAAEPDNPEGFYLKAWACKSMKDNAAALEAIRTAVTMNGGRDNHIKDRMLTVREAALASGAGIRDAAVLAMAAPFTHTPVHRALNGMMVIGTELKDAVAAGDHDRMLELAGLGLSAAERLKESSKSSDLMDELVASTLEKAVLSVLPPDTEIGATGTSAALQLEAFNARREELMKFLKQGNLLEAIRAAASDAEIAEYTDRRILYGERAAMEWLLEMGAGE